MERHARAVYDVVGEGRYQESAQPQAGDGSAARPPAVTAPGFRFSRVGPRNTQHPPAALRGKLAAVLPHSSKHGLSSAVPAGFTYLGQFIDHDLTFDRTPLHPDPAAVRDLVSERSPTLDLDSLYGFGPDVTPEFYADGVRLRTGVTDPVPGDPLTAIAHDGYDLPRPADRKLALIPDPRNDENLAVAQTHLAFIRFHNHWVEELADRVPAGELFTRARDQVVRHYQWLLRTDFLPRIVEPSLVDDVFRNGRRVVDPHPAPGAAPTMPVEFSVACFRLGHSMVRDGYEWNRLGDRSLAELFRLTGTSGTLGLGRRLPSDAIVDLRRLHDFDDTQVAHGVVVPTPDIGIVTAMALDPQIVTSLTVLPDGAIAGPDPDPARHNLAARNLERAQHLQLCTGQQLADLFRDRGVRVRRPTAANILHHTVGLAPPGLLTTAEQRFLATATPLWIYILVEAANHIEEHDHQVLTGVGGRIVVETIHRAMAGTTPSILTDPAWRPSSGPNPSTFRMVDLLMAPFGNDPTRLNPLGPADLR